MPEKRELREAATVMLVRDGADGMLVFMVRRNPRAAFVGGAYVFPGGAVDEEDRLPAVAEFCAGRTDADASARLGVPAGGLAYWVAAIRECYEEAGILLACDERGRLVSFTDERFALRFAARRKTCQEDPSPLLGLCREEGLRLATDRLHYCSHWITPEGEPRRFDTRFFVAAAPDGQTPRHDATEIVDQVWIRPGEALDRQRRGEFTMILPTIKQLEFLAAYDSVASLLADACRERPIPTVQPRMIRGPQGVRVLLPGDPDFDGVLPVAP